MSRTETQRYAVDRREGDLLVLIPDEGEDELLLRAADAPDLAPGDVADVTVKDGQTVAVKVAGEGERRSADLGKRLSALFARTPKKEGEDR